jgi:O-antigen/teichoic acid export membrane protein
MVRLAMARESKALRPTSMTPETVEPDHASPLDLRGAVLTGVRWKMLTQVVFEGSRVVVAIALTHLLSPTDYGVAAMAFVAASLAGVLVDPSLGQVLVQRPAITEDDRSTAFWTTLGVGALFTIGGVALSGVVAGWFGEPQVQGLFLALSLGFVIGAAGVTQTALLTRELAFRSLEIRQIVATLIGSVFALAIGLAGLGPWAIIGNSLAYTVSCTVMVWFLTPWRPRLIYAIGSLRSMGGFSSKLFVTRILGWANGYADNLLVGRYLGPADLGAYSLAFSVCVVPLVDIARPIEQLMGPTFAKINDPERLERVWLHSKRLACAMLAPGFLALIIAAPDLVPVVFGEKWQSAVVPLQLLCLGGVAVALTALNGSFLYSQGKGGTLLHLNVAFTVVTVVGFVVGLHWGIVGVAASYAVTRWLIVPLNMVMVTRAVGINFWKTMGAGGLVLLLAVAATVGEFAVRQALIAGGVPAFARLVVESAAFLVFYLALLRVAAPAVLSEILDVLLRGRRSRVAREAAAPS